jgi:hypothetical protein
MLYCLKLVNGSPLFLRLTQHQSGEVEAVIPNTPEAELKEEQINQQVAAWCLNYWTKSKPGGAAFYCKLANHAFTQVLLHEMSKCTWGSVSQTVTSPNAQSEMVKIAEFENQDWVQDIFKLTKDISRVNAKTYADPHKAFPFQDDFSVGTIHWANATKQTVTCASTKAALASQATDGDASKVSQQSRL